jgi:hypothetical protein
MTPLDKTLKRAITIKGQEYVITLSPESLKIARKGHRLGVDLNWAELISGESALAVALRASIGRFDRQVAAAPKHSPLSAEDRLPKRAAAARQRPATRRKRR